MKKIIGFVLVAVLSLTMATACGDQNEAEQAAASEVSATTAASEPSEKETETAAKASTVKQETERTVEKETEAAKKATQKKETKKATTEAKKKPKKETTKPTKSKKEIAQSYVGKSVGSLISAIGSPKSRSYAPSCLGEGEDGELKYSGFTVYTYKENGKETVQHVE